jgi:hypothetical protein
MYVGNPTLIHARLRRSQVGLNIWSLDQRVSPCALSIETSFAGTTKLPPIAQMSQAIADFHAWCADRSSICMSLRLLCAGLSADVNCAVLTLLLGAPPILATAEADFTLAEASSTGSQNV